jgi:hypothetical protein
VAAVTRSAEEPLWLAPDRLPVLRAAGGDAAAAGEADDEPRALIVPADDACVAGQPMWSQVADVLPAPAAAAEALADALDLRLLDDGEPPVATDPSEVPTPAAVLALVPGTPASYVECEDLSVDGVPVEWWVSGSRVYAATTAGLARGLAQAAGRWDTRAMLETVLSDPGRGPGFALERAWDAS